MSEPKNANERLHALMDALAERTEAASDRDVLADADAEGIDVKVEASRVRGLLSAAVLGTKKARLRLSVEAHQAAVSSLQSRVSQLPADPGQRRDLLTRVLSRKPQMREAALTLQHRDFESFSDADVNSLLKQVLALGLLDDEPVAKK